MKRRDFIISSAAIALLPSVSFGGVGKDYTPGLVEKELKAGKTVFLDFYTAWCSTCASQARTVSALMAQNPAYEANISFIRVDWDLHSRSKLSKSLKIPRRSTLVALKGDQEIGRIVAGTRKADIKALMDAALGAATA